MWPPLRLPWAERPIAGARAAAYGGPEPVDSEDDNDDTDLSVDLARWFKSDELETCPRCGNRRLIPSEASDIGIRICLDCGAIDLRETP